MRKILVVVRRRWWLVVDRADASRNGGGVSSPGTRSAAEKMLLIETNHGLVRSRVTQAFANDAFHVRRVVLQSVERDFVIDERALQFRKLAAVFFLARLERAHLGVRAHKKQPGEQSERDEQKRVKSGDRATESHGAAFARSLSICVAMERTFSRKRRAVKRFRRSAKPQSARRARPRGAARIAHAA
jgi:hypothetical protein